MARVKLIVNKEDIAPEHYPLFDELAALRGRISGPSTVVLHSPRLAKPWNEISEYLHRLSIVEPAAAELAVSAAAREKDCPYVWAAHVPLAQKAGVGDETIIAVRDRLPLDDLPRQEATVVRYVRQLMGTNRVEYGVFGELLDAHGAQWLVELTAWIGRYAALAGVLNGFEVWPVNPKAELPVAAGASAPRPAARGPDASPRITPITSRDQVAPEHGTTFDAVAASRGSVRGPWPLLMYSPVLCLRVFDVANFFRSGSQLTPAMRELATIATAREKDCPFVWAAHVTTARTERVSEVAVAVVRDRSDLAALLGDERDVVDYVRQQLQTHRVTQDLFDRLRERHSVRWLVELTCLMGHFGVLASVLNAFEVAPAAGAEQLP